MARVFLQTILALSAVCLSRGSADSDHREAMAAQNALGIDFFGMEVDGSKPASAMPEVMDLKITMDADVETKLWEEQVGRGGYIQVLGKHSAEGAAVVVRPYACAWVFYKLWLGCEPW